jgi:hypothetical protein
MRGATEAIPTILRVLRTFSYSGGHFDVESDNGEELVFARIPIMFTIDLAPDADKCYLDEVGKLLSLFIAESYGKPGDPRDN